jgi:ubiquinone/menaquinone biosynthesis C-methylase UbiE
MNESIRDQWEKNAAAFSELIGGEGTPHHKRILNPCVERLLGNVKNKTLLDAGCGEGYLSRYYARKGAVVTGIDISPKLIETAEKQGADVNYRVADVCNLDEFQNESFDLVMSNLVLLNIPCLEDALKEFCRVLKPHGELVFSIVHPAFNFYGPGSWQMGNKDSDTNRRRGIYFKVDQYFEEKEYQRYWKTRTGENFPVPISFFHRTLSTYLNTLSRIGFQLIEFAEPEPVDSDPFFDRERRVPFFVVLKVRKV